MLTLAQLPANWRAEEAGSSWPDLSHSQLRPGRAWPANQRRELSNVTAGQPITASQTSCRRDLSQPDKLEAAEKPILMLIFWPSYFRCLSDRNWWEPIHVDMLIILTITNNFCLLVKDLTSFVFNILSWKIILGCLDSLTYWSWSLQKGTFFCPKRVNYSHIVTKGFVR